VIHRSKTILWNGPMGVFEMQNFNTAQRHSDGCSCGNSSRRFFIGSGGDSVAAG